MGWCHRVYIYNPPDFTSKRTFYCFQFKSIVCFMSTHVLCKMQKIFTNLELIGGSGVYNCHGGPTNWQWVAIDWQVIDTHLQSAFKYALICTNSALHYARSLVHHWLMSCLCVGVCGKDFHGSLFDHLISPQWTLALSPAKTQGLTDQNIWMECISEHYDGHSLTTVLEFWLEVEV